MNLFNQILTTLALVLGIAAGETISTRVFGTLKKRVLYLIEIIFFVVIIVLTFNTITMTKYSNIIIVSLYFFNGFLTIIFVRGIISGLGLFSIHIKKNILRQKDEVDYILGLKKSLERHGFGIKDIFKIAKETGFSKKNIDKVLTYFNLPIKNKNKKKKSKRKAY